MRINFNRPGPSSQTRRSAIKARKSITTRGAKDTLEQTDKTIQTVKRRRRQRHAKLKEMAKEEEEGTLGESWLDKFNGVEIVCPVCSTTVRGDQDVVNAHVDACVAHESLRLEDVRQRALQYRRAIEDAARDEEDDDSFGNYVGNLRGELPLKKLYSQYFHGAQGTGFYQRNRNEEDVDDEVDIEGDEQAVYGEVQFTEGDVLPVTIEREDREEDVEVNIEDDEEDETQQGQQTLRELVAASDVGKTSSGRQRRMDDHTSMSGLEEVESVIASARQKGSNVLLAAALENKIKFLVKICKVVACQRSSSIQQESARAMSSPSLQCRICLDPYAEPTLSTGCWHTCCRECWLRCLGSTKLCPICKRITCATDLRRIYL